jgi:hypothetical protein
LIEQLGHLGIQFGMSFRGWITAHEHHHIETRCAFTQASAKALPNPTLQLMTTHGAVGSFGRDHDANTRSWLGRASWRDQNYRIFASRLLLAVHDASIIATVMEAHGGRKREINAHDGRIVANPLRPSVSPISITRGG